MRLTDEVGPSAIEIEEMVIGSSISEKDSMHKAKQFLTAFSFSKMETKAIWNSISELYDESKKIDLLTVTERLKLNGNLDLVGGPLYITKLNGISSMESLEEHCLILKQYEVKRGLLRMSLELQKKSQDDTENPITLLDDTADVINKMISNTTISFEENTTELVNSFTKHLEHVKAGGSPGIPCTLDDLNAMMNGFRKTDLTIVAARPGMGKSALVKSMIKGCVHTNNKVAVFSLEMSSMQWTARLISEDTDTPAQDYMNGNFSGDFDQIHQATTQYYNRQGEPLLFIDDTAGLNIIKLKARAKSLKEKHDVQMIIIDYIQLMSGTGKQNSREQEISEISRGCKIIAKELDVPVIALSQLSRATEQHQNNRPQLRDLRESGAIEQDADAVIFIYRPHYYANVEPEFEYLQLPNGQTVPSEGYAELIIAKHRNGALGSVYTKFVDRLTKFENLESNPFI